MSLRFRPDIEGLRALAIVPVVMFHAWPASLPGGFVGVDVFFVISGFLITSLLMQRLGAGQYSIVAFYGARIRRIFPALFFMLALVVPVAWLLLPPQGLQEFGRTLGATAVFFSNMELYQTTGYFDTATELKPLVHTWSLAVEEQYYIVFPLLLAALYRHWRSGLAWVLLGVGLVSLALSIRLVEWNAPLAFYSALSRTFELMAGSLLATGLGPQVPRPVREAATALGLAAILASCAFFSAMLPFPGAWALLPCGGAALIIWGGGQGDTAVGRLLSLPLLRWIGALSFSLYLWHWPVLVFTRHLLLGEPHPWQAGLAVALALALAYASLRWVETPVRRASHTDRRLLGFGTAAIVLTLGLAWGLMSQHLRRPDSPQETVLYAGARDVSPERNRCHGRGNKEMPYAQACRFGAGSSASHAVVWADSHGVELAFALGEAAGRQGYSVAQITASSCPPALDFDVPGVRRCRGHNRATVQALAADPTVDTVVMVARYGYYLALDRDPFLAGLRNSVAALSAAGKRVVLVEPVPGYRYPVPAALAALARRGAAVAGFEQSVADYRAEHRAVLDLLQSLAADPNVSVVPTSGLLCETGRCQVVAGDKPLYFDDNHLSMAGARLLATAFKPRQPVVSGQR